MSAGYLSVFEHPSKQSYQTNNADQMLLLLLLLLF